MRVFLPSVGIAASVLVLYHIGEMLQWDAAWSVAGFSVPTHLMVLPLGVVVYVRMSRGTWLGVNDAYGMALLCVNGAALSTACVVFVAAGLYPATAAAGAVLVVVACAAYTVVPGGMRLIRLVFS